MTTPHDRQQADRRLGLQLALAGVAAFLIAVPFMVMLALVKAEWAPLVDLDTDVANELNSFALDRAWLVTVLEVWGVVSDPWTLRIAVLAIVGWLWTRGLRRLAAWAVVTLIIGGVLGVVLKLVAERSRPVFDDPVAQADGFSFPSGHALNSLLCAGIVLLVFLPVLSPRGRVLAYVLAALFVLATGFDRIALGVHYVSDVLAGWVVASACLVATVAAFEIWRRGEGRRPAGPTEGVEPEAAGRMSEPGSVRS